jgi:hypothetical protein
VHDREVVRVVEQREAGLGGVERGGHLAGPGQRPVQHLADGPPRLGLGPRQPELRDQPVEVEHGAIVAPP